MKLHKFKQRTAEPKNIECRMSKDGIAALSHFFYKIDSIHPFDIRHSLFDIRYSLFQSFSFDQTGRSRPEAALTPDTYLLPHLQLELES
jgi:hypothetical protein